MFSLKEKAEGAMPPAFLIKFRNANFLCSASGIYA